MNEYLYQRQVIAYHGCDGSVAEKVLKVGDGLLPSKKEYDWLGEGIYFWEHGPERALDWARERQTMGTVDEPAVVGALLHLGRCFDLLDTRYTSELREIWPEFVQAMGEADKPNPHNVAPKGAKDGARLLHYRDCAVISWILEQLEEREQLAFDSVRGVF